MKESYLHFIWRTKSFCQLPLTCLHGEELIVRSPGYYNNHAGPDFLDARIEINGVPLTGKVEIHVKASDWNVHKHQFDKRYEDVILHVVYEADEEAPKGVPLFEMKRHVLAEQLDKMIALGMSEHTIPCGIRFIEVNELIRRNWLERMVIERMQERASSWERRLSELNGDLVQLMHEKVARVFGFGLNGEAFEELARRLPYQIIIRYREDEIVFRELPVLLSGASMSTDKGWNRRTLLVQFKHELQAMSGLEFNSGRVNPRRKHEQRIHLWTIMLLELTQCWKMVLEESDSKMWFEWFRKIQKKGLSSSLMIQLVVNFFVPMQFLLARHYADELRSELGLALLEGMKQEDNAVIRKWRKNGIQLNNASESQAYLNLFNVYCTHKQCLNCAIGAQLLKQHESSKVFF